MRVVAWRGRGQRHSSARVIEIALPQPLSNADQREHAQRPRQAIPAETLIQAIRNLGEKAHRAPLERGGRRPAPSQAGRMNVVNLSAAGYAAADVGRGYN